MANEYLRKRQERDRAFFEAGWRTGAQVVTDYISQSLNDPDVMGKSRVCARGSLDKIFANCRKLDEHYSAAFDPDNVEADYVREEWDSVMRDIYGADADSFDKRYPYARDIHYLKPKKGWVD